MRETPLSYIQQRGKDDAQLQVRRTTGGYYTVKIRGSKDRGHETFGVNMRQDELNALAQFFDHWRTDGVKRYAYPTDGQVDAWAAIKLKELINGGQV